LPLRTRFSMVAIVRPPAQGRELAHVDPAGSDEGVQVADGDADVAAELDVGMAVSHHRLVATGSWQAAAGYRSTTRATATR
jgi:hypothetical protein